MAPGLHLVSPPEDASFKGRGRARLGTWPTPVEKMEKVSEALGTEIWVKREDLCGAWGGNKVRKLDFWLADERVRTKRHIIVSGAGSSTWTAAAALHGRRSGLDVTVALAGPIPEERARLYADVGARVVHFSHLNALPLSIARAKLSAPRARRLPMGGSGWPGDLGSYLCGIEVIEGFLRGDDPRPKRIFVAAGTTGTAAGMAAALSLGGHDIPVVAVRVAPRPFASRSAVVRRADRLVKKLGPSPQATPLAIEGEERFFGKGYGRPAPGVDEALELARSDGIELERTYTGKAFAALIAHTRAGAKGPFLFIQTAAGPLPNA